MRREMSCSQESIYRCPSRLLLQSPAPKGQLGCSNDWQLDPTELASKFTPRTKILVLNTPNNPLGKVPGVHSEISASRLSLPDLSMHSLSPQFPCGKWEG